MAKVKITQVKSSIGGKQKQRSTLKSLGLRRIGHSVEREDDASTLGMIRRVVHLVRVEETK